MATAELISARRRVQYYCHCCDRRVDAREVDGEHQCSACGDTFVERVDDSEELHRFLESEVGRQLVTARETTTSTGGANAADGVNTAIGANTQASTGATSTGSTNTGADVGSGLESLLMLSSLLERIEQRRAEEGEPRGTDGPRGERANEGSGSPSLARVLIASVLGAQGASAALGGGGIDRNRLGDYYFGNMNDVLHHILVRDGGSQGAPPASEQALVDLRSVSVTISEDEAASCAATAARVEAAAAVSNEREAPTQQGTPESDYMCPVCMDVYEEGQKVVRTRCGHRFHLDCISRWLQTHNTCPICRESVA